MVVCSSLRAADTCETLSDLKLENTTITMAKTVTSLGHPKDNANIGVKSFTSEAFCRVTATIKSGENSNINMEVWLPTRSSWNGKFLGTGTGGAGGSIFHDYLVAGLRKGYATANTDLGTSINGEPPPNFDFGIGNPEKQIDWAYRSTHLMTTISKQIIKSYYGENAKLAYFKGCSSGGLQAVAEATKFPHDYDGIIAEAPGNNRTNIHMNILWAHQAVHKEAGSYFSPAKISLIHKAVLNACDGIDGIVDGVIDEPRRCRFDPALLLCADKEDDACLTEPQVEAMQKIYAGPSNPRTGEQYFPGLPRGAEASPMGLKRILDNGRPNLAELVIGLLAWSPNSTWNGQPMDFDFDVHAEAVNKELGHLNATDSDLSVFKDNGGKIIFWSGTADGIPHSEDLINYYESVQDTMGGPQSTKDFARLFMAPGVHHCGGGPGPNHFDLIDALDTWVVNKKAPQRIVATKFTNDDPRQSVLRTRPLCPYPEVARWNGSGNIDDASNFVCSLPALQ